MFYNTSRATQFALKSRDLPRTTKSLNKYSSPKERLLNLKKREKLKNLLIAKFSQKYKLDNTDEILDTTINEFIQNEKLTDVDLKRLNVRIQKLIKEKTAKNKLKSKLVHTYNNKDLTKNNTEQEVSKEYHALKPQMSNTISNNKIVKDIKIKNEFPTINPITSYINIMTPPQRLLKNSANNSFDIKRHQIRYYRNPAEELAELERELEVRQSLTKRNYKRIDFSKDGDEWNAIVKYNKKIFDKNIMKEKLKDKEIKKKNKDFLDFQVKEKIKKEAEEELKEKEYNKAREEYIKKLDEIEEVKAQKIKEQLKRLNENRNILLKNEKIRKRIEELKEKKYESILVENYKRSLEKAQKEKIERKRRENEELKKAIKENEIKHQL